MRLDILVYLKLDLPGGEPYTSNMHQILVLKYFD